MIDIKSVNKSLDKLVNVAIIVEDLFPNQQTFFTIKNANDVCQKYVGIDINIFSENIGLLILKPLVPIIETKYMTSCYDYFMFYDISLLVGYKDYINTGIPILYIPDLSFMNETHSYNNFQKLVKENQAIIVYRHDSYKKIIEEEFNFTGSFVCDDFDIKEIMLNILRKKML